MPYQLIESKIVRSFPYFCEVTRERNLLQEEIRSDTIFTALYSYYQAHPGCKIHISVSGDPDRILCTFYQRVKEDGYIDAYAEMDDIFLASLSPINQKRWERVLGYLKTEPQFWGDLYQIPVWKESMFTLCLHRKEYCSDAIVKIQQRILQDIWSTQK